MSVLAANRSISTHEYEDRFNKFYYYAYSQLATIPRRKVKWVSLPVANGMNNASKIIYEMTNQCHKNIAQQNEYRAKLAPDAINAIYSINKPLISMWNLIGSTEKCVNMWAYHIRRNIEVLSDIAGDQSLTREVVVLTMTKSPAIYINKIQELHRYTYGKIIRAPMQMDDMVGRNLADFVDSALFYAEYANMLNPTIEDEYYKRREYLEIAVDNMNSMNRFMYIYCIANSYSNSTLTEWSCLLNESIKMVGNIMISDNKRFNNIGYNTAV